MTDNKKIKVPSKWTEKMFPCKEIIRDVPVVRLGTKTSLMPIMEKKKEDG